MRERMTRSRDSPPAGPGPDDRFARKRQPAATSPWRGIAIARAEPGDRGTKAIARSPRRARLTDPPATTTATDGDPEAPWLREIWPASVLAVPVPPEEPHPRELRGSRATHRSRPHVREARGGPERGCRDVCPASRREQPGAAGLRAWSSHLGATTVSGASDGGNAEPERDLVTTQLPAESVGLTGNLRTPTVSAVERPHAG